MHPDGAVHAVVQKNHNCFGAVLSSSGQLLTIHEEITIACNGKDNPARQHRRRNASRHAITHGTHSGGQLCFKTLADAVVLVIPVHPTCKIACAIGQHRIRRQMSLQN